MFLPIWWEYCRGLGWREFRAKFVPSSVETKPTPLSGRQEEVANIGLPSTVYGHRVASCKGSAERCHLRREDERGFTILFNMQDIFGPSFRSPDG